MKYLFTGITSVLILIAVILPGSTIPDVGFIGFDKVVHIGMFGTWAVAVCYDFNARGYRHAGTFTAGLAFSLLTEVVQIFVEGRTFDWSDMVADAIGLFLGLVLAGAIIRLIRKIFNIDSSKPS